MTFVHTLVVSVSSLLVLLYIPVCVVANRGKSNENDKDQANSYCLLWNSVMLALSFTLFFGFWHFEGVGRSLGRQVITEAFYFTKEIMMVACVVNTAKLFDSYFIKNSKDTISTVQIINNFTSALCGVVVCLPQELTGLPDHLRVTVSFFSVLAILTSSVSRIAGVCLKDRQEVLDLLEPFPSVTYLLYNAVGYSAATQAYNATESALSVNCFLVAILCISFLLKITIGTYHLFERYTNIRTPLEYAMSFSPLMIFAWFASARSEVCTLYYVLLSLSMSVAIVTFGSWLAAVPTLTCLLPSGRSVYNNVENLGWQIFKASFQHYIIFDIIALSSYLIGIPYTNTMLVVASMQMVCTVPMYFDMYRGNEKIVPPDSAGEEVDAVLESMGGGRHSVPIYRGSISSIVSEYEPKLGSDKISIKKRQSVPDFSETDIANM